MFAFCSPYDILANRREGKTWGELSGKLPDQLTVRGFPRLETSITEVRK